MFSNNHFLGIDLIWWVGGLFFLLACLFLYTRISNRNSKNVSQNILQQRLSLGEISALEYEQMIRHLQKDQDQKLRTYFLSAVS